MQNNDLEPFSIQPIVLDKIINDKKHHYNLKYIYYCMDGKNIFKRTERYRFKYSLLIIFSFMIVINLHEILFNIILLSQKIDPDSPNREKDAKTHNYWVWNIVSEYFCDFYILCILSLSLLTFCKFGIDTKIYY